MNYLENYKIFKTFNKTNNIQLELDKLNHIQINKTTSSQFTNCKIYTTDIYEINSERNNFDFLINLKDLPEKYLFSIKVTPIFETEDIYAEHIWTYLEQELYNRYYQAWLEAYTNGTPRVFTGMFIRCNHCIKSIEQIEGNTTINNYLLINLEGYFNDWEVSRQNPARFKLQIIIDSGVTFNELRTNKT